MSVAERITAKIAALRPKVESVSMPDWCDIRREMPGAADEFGNPLPPTVSTIESRPCALRASGMQPNERALADRLGWSAPYAIDLEPGTLVTRADTIRLNGNRTFEVGGVVDEGSWAVVATVVCEER